VDDFFWCGGEAFFLGFFQKSASFAWCFGGEDVVFCVVDVVS
jgi:hypothetical protein